MWMMCRCSERGIEFLWSNFCEVNLCHFVECVVKGVNTLVSDKTFQYLVVTVGVTRCYECDECDKETPDVCPRTSPC
jgi:hypothetical protein